MTEEPRTPQRIRPAMLLVGLAALAVVVALLTPETADNTGGQLSTSSAAPGGGRIVFELLKKLGWSATRRETTLD